ncbi:SDR family oxidoreductase [Dysgonomonas sp. 521]|uniref:SDR family NAD(P)-dependent oxidoreductase n=1 Tax=Dysgonomonas sp. 521 TaxID=2302932 RepID=UPI0013D45856|nr:SDR family oxidoreductase [Dysgonomonas sp. 521]NDV95742.1 SDR family oxidoreductase [Dysgonomonas sp. 521]
MSERRFTDDEWKACIKVLTALKDDPFDNPDNETFKTLITKIHKNARKSIRKDNSSQRKIDDTEILLSSEIAKQAQNNTSAYSEGEIEDRGYKQLNSLDNCYACNQPFDRMHFFYSRLCPECAEYNYRQRFEPIDLTNRNVILTGGRVKIGYATALKVLRAGGNLILTSRFPALALEQLSNEPDYTQWKDRLIVYGLDLRNLRAVEDFIEFVKSEFKYLDILINNAAQTIKYTDSYYTPLINNEALAFKKLENGSKLLPNKTSVTQETKLLELKDMPIVFDKNRFGQPVDNREKNSWNSKLDEISMYELLEVNLINQISPYLLIKELKYLFLKSEFPDRFIINVTSSEGQFSYTNKTIFHPHTNMTKAALNMMTRTSAEEFAEDAIYMNSVDVGWVSTGAKEELRKKQFEKGYIPPLDSVDGAARILDPIRKIIGGNKLYGKLLKNYKETNW